MYAVKQIRNSANFHFIGAIVAVLAGIISQLVATPNSDVSGVVIGNLLTMAAFGVGFFLLQMGGSSNVMRRVTQSEAAALDNPPAAPKLKFGINSFTLDVGGMILAIVVMVIINLLFGSNLSVALGGFVGGWLIGGMANQRRFAAKVVDEQMRQRRIFYFSEPALGPRTEVSYFYVDTVKASDPIDTSQPFIPTSLTKTDMPRIHNSARKVSPSRSASGNAKTKAAPLVRNTAIKSPRTSSKQAEAKKAQPERKSPKQDS